MFGAILALRRFFAMVEMSPGLVKLEYGLVIGRHQQKTGNAAAFYINIC